MTTIPVGDDLRDALLACLAVQRWADDVTGQAPFATSAALIESARQAATPLTRSEIDEALAEHPRIGEKPTGSSQAAGFSRSEQASADADDTELAAAIAAGNQSYEKRFDRVFLIRAAGRSRREILGELQRRLLLDDDTEAAIVGSELRDIALLRLAVLAREWQDVSVPEILSSDSAAPTGDPR
jgi:2-oxo-4-hydroxy-4-carboxy-5-ureidoimidazoline decarboxylase